MARTRKNTKANIKNRKATTPLKDLNGKVRNLPVCVETQTNLGKNAIKTVELSKKTKHSPLETKPSPVKLLRTYPRSVCPTTSKKRGKDTTTNNENKNKALIFEKLKPNDIDLAKKPNTKRNRGNEISFEILQDKIILKNNLISNRSKLKSMQGPQKNNIISEETMKISNINSTYLTREKTLEENLSKHLSPSATKMRATLKILSSTDKCNSKTSVKTGEILPKLDSDKKIFNVIDSEGISKICNFNDKYQTARKYHEENLAESSSILTKKFVIKLKRIPTKTKPQVNALPLTPATGRPSVDNLDRKRVSVANHVLLEPITPNQTRNLFVRLHNFENMNNMSSKHSYSATPVIDSNKRFNFNKLSLTKSFRKLSKNMEAEKLTDSNYHDNQMIVECYSNNKDETRKELQLNAEKKLTNNFKMTGVKQNPILSLKRPNKLTNKNIAALDIAQFKPENNSRMCRAKSISKESLNRETLETKSPKNKNLANNSEEIENLLNCLDDEEEIILNLQENRNEIDCLITENNRNKNVQTQNNTSAISNKTNKFFHSKKKDVLNNSLNDLPMQTEKLPTTQTLTKKRRCYTKRSTNVKRDNIYEFFSQSQTSDSDIIKHADPTADIVRKLIDEGKVRVATNCKGKGKPKFKRKNPQRRINKINQNADKKLKQVQNKIKKVKFTRKNEDEAIENENFVDHFESDEQYSNIDDEVETQRQKIVSNISKNRDHKNVANEQEGTFSRLARTVLINQAGRSDLQIEDQSMLQERARKFVSTPKNKKTTSLQIALDVDLSPINMQPPKPATKASPWRVNEDQYLPKTFNFCRSSKNLPSFSCDVIPSTPRKRRSKIYLNGSHQMSITCANSSTKNRQQNLSSTSSIQSLKPDDAQNKQQTQHLNESSLISFSSNDSNAENVPPPKRTLENFNENENIFDLKQLPNLRRSRSNRSPLKTINILEIVHLPPYKNLNKARNPKETSSEQIELAEEVLNDTFRGEYSIVAATEEQGHNVGTTNDENHLKKDIFGFEELLSQNEFSSQGNNESNNDMSTNEQNQTIRDKLNDLRKLKPAENEIEKKVENTKRTMPLFIDDATKVDGLRQRDIKEMFSSTLLDPQPSTSKEALRQLKNNLKNPKPRFKEDLDLSELFKDPDPETTFNENEAHRTYIRPYKRKRRLKENKYVVFLDSDVSENEDNSHEDKKCHHSRESNSSPEKAPNKKRHRKLSSEKPELVEFIKEFNEMCREVDSYNLIVE